MNYALQEGNGISCDICHNINPSDSYYWRAKKIEHHIITIGVHTKID